MIAMGLQAGRLAAHGFVDGLLAEATPLPPEEPDLPVRVEAAVAHPPRGPTSPERSDRLGVRTPRERPVRAGPTTRGPG
jgi:hypothetical protein